MNPIVIIAGAVALVGLLWAKGYLGFADIFGLAATANPVGMVKQTANDVFAKAVKLAMEEAHEEVAAKMAGSMRDQVVQAHLAAFPGSGPPAQSAPEAPSAAPPAS